MCWVPELLPLCQGSEFLSSEEKLVNGDRSGRDIRDGKDSRDSGTTKHQEAPPAQRRLSHAPWDAPAATSPWTGSRRSSGGKLSISCIQRPPCSVCSSSSAAAEADGSGNSAELGDTAPSPPALDPASPSQPGNRGRGLPGQPVSAAFPEQMAAAWGGRRRLSASFLSCTHSVIAGSSGGRCRWGQLWPYISHGFSELSPRGQATQED